MWVEYLVQHTTKAKAEGKDKGVAVKDNKFIGPPILKMTEKILAKQKQISKLIIIPSFTIVTDNEYNFN